MEGSLPLIRDVYNQMRQNRDYNVVRKYEGKTIRAINPKATRKDHYI